MKLYPVMLNAAGRKVTVIGGGKVALRKIQDLIECGAFVTVISPEIEDSILQIQKTDPEKIEIINRPYRKGDLKDSLMVFSAANNEKVNREVYNEAVERNIIINAVDDPSNCSFFVPSTFYKGDLIVAVSTSGVSPSMAAKIRREIESTIPESISDTLGVLKKSRKILKEDDDFKDFTSEKRGEILKRITGNDDLLKKIAESENDNELKKFISAQCNDL